MRHFINIEYDLTEIWGRVLAGYHGPTALVAFQGDRLMPKPVWRSILLGTSVETFLRDRMFFFIDRHWDEILHEINKATTTIGPWRGTPRLYVHTDGTKIIKCGFVSDRRQLPPSRNELDEMKMEIW